jgi:hypothetical protein
MPGLSNGVKAQRISEERKVQYKRAKVLRGVELRCFWNTTLPKKRGGVKLTGGRVRIDHEPLITPTLTLPRRRGRGLGQGARADFSIPFV